MSLVELEVESIGRLALSVSDRRAPRQLPLVTCVAPTGLARIMEYEEGKGCTWHHTTSALGKRRSSRATRSKGNGAICRQPPNVILHTGVL